MRALLVSAGFLRTTRFAGVFFFAFPMIRRFIVAKTNESRYILFVPFRRAS